jgi:predicted PurR-regulated permease PerM
VDTSQQHKAFLLLLAVVTVAFFWLLIPFFGAVFWAVILAIVFQPLHRLILRRLGGRANLAATLSVLVCIVIAIIPTTIIVSSLVAEGAQLVQRLQQGQFDLPQIVSRFVASLPTWAQDWFARIDAGDLQALRDRLSAALVAASQAVAGQALSVGQLTLRFIGSVGIMLYVLFFLFRDGTSIGNNLLAAMPLSIDYSRRLLAMFAAVVRATVKGNIIIAIIQGSIGGVTFWLLGIQAALLWGVLMTFLSMLPAVGAGLVWVPVAVYLFLSGAILKGVVLVAVGILVISLIDNLLRPMLVGKDTRLPDYVVLVSTVGGMSLFGINGFVIGPLIAALFIASWRLFRDEQGRSAGPAP